MGHKAIICTLFTVGVFLIACYVSKIYFFRKVASHYRNFVFTDIYETAVCFYLNIAVIKTLINPHNIKFSITNKGVDASKTDYKMFLPQAVLLCFTIASFIVPIRNLYYHIFTIDALLVNLFFNLFNTIVLIFAIKVTLEKPDLRKERRIPMHTKATLEAENKTTIETKVLDISREGALLHATLKESKLLKPQPQEAILNMPEIDATPLKIVNSYRTKKGRYYNCKFQIKSKTNEDKILKLAFKNSNTW